MQRKGAPRGMEALPILFHTIILPRRKGSLGLMIKFFMCSSLYSLSMAIAIWRSFRHLFPRPHPVHVIKPHDAPLLLRQAVQPAFRVLACLRERKRFFCGAALIVHQFRDDPRHLVMVVRSGWHAGEDRGQPLCPGAQHIGFFIQPPDLLTQETQAVQIFKGQVSSPVFRSKHLCRSPHRFNSRRTAARMLSLLIVPSHPRIADNHLLYTNIPNITVPFSLSILQPA